MWTAWKNTVATRGTEEGHSCGREQELWACSGSVSLGHAKLQHADWQPQLNKRLTDILKKGYWTSTTAEVTCPPSSYLTSLSFDSDHLVIFPPQRNKLWLSLTLGKAPLSRRSCLYILKSAGQTNLKIEFWTGHLNVMRKYTLVQFINSTAVKRSTYKQLNLPFWSKNVSKPCYNKEEFWGNNLVSLCAGCKLRRSDTLRDHRLKGKLRAGQPPLEDNS